MIREVKFKDISETVKLVNFWARKSRLLAVTKKEIKERIGLSWIWEERKRIVGYVSLLIYRKDLAEVRSLCVQEKYQKKGIGTKLLKKTLQEAKKRNITTVLVITKVPQFYNLIGFQQKLEGKEALLIDPRRLKYK